MEGGVFWPCFLTPIDLTVENKTDDIFLNFIHLSLKRWNFLEKVNINTLKKKRKKIKKVRFHDFSFLS